MRLLSLSSEGPFLLADIEVVAQPTDRDATVEALELAMLEQTSAVVLRRGLGKLDPSKFERTRGTERAYLLAWVLNLAAEKNQQFQPA